MEETLFFLAGNTFAGKGSITAEAPEEISILANTFDGVRLNLGDVSRSEVQIRNNKGMNLHATTSNFPRCNAIDGGFAAGCDIRATCTSLARFPFDIQCSCEDSGLLAANADGSKCIQPQKFEALTATTRIRLDIKKPLDETSKFQILAKGDESFNVSVEIAYGQSSSGYLVVDELQGSSHVAMSLSSARTEIVKKFDLTAIGSLTSMVAPLKV